MISDSEIARRVFEIKRSLQGIWGKYSDKDNPNRPRLGLENELIYLQGICTHKWDKVGPPGYEYHECVICLLERD